MAATETVSTQEGTPRPAPPAAVVTPAQPGRRRWRAVVAVVVLVVVLGAIGRWALRSFGVVSTDDAYVNGRVTFVAPRVPGQIARVLVDDNNRVRKGDLLVELDKEPYQLQLDTAQAALDAAQSEVTVAMAQTRGVEGQMRSLRFALDQAMEDVDNQVALLRSRVATLNSRRASLEKAQSDYDRVATLGESNAISREDIDRRREALMIAKAQVEESLQGVYQIRASLGIPPQPPSSEDLAQVPPDINQTASEVRRAQASLVQAAAQVGVTDSFNKTPRQLVTDFYKRDPTGDIDKIYEQILKDAPAVKQAQARLLQAQRGLEQARLNLRYCDVLAEIDGVVTRREANPGNNVVAGQALMAIRSLTEIWVDANFKETQLARLRIGQPVDLDVDMYGGTHRFRGRVTGFTMGTGSTLSLLPAENATGNFVKVVQRLPVRIDLIDYDPEQAPLFVGLSVTPRVHVGRAPDGPNAGKVLQPYAAAGAAVPAGTGGPSAAGRP